MAAKDFSLDECIKVIIDSAAIDAIYLYGSRAKGKIHEKSDWDFAVLYSKFEPDILERYARPQLLEAQLEQKFKMYDLISVVDIEIVPPPLQYNIISGKKIYDRNVPHVRRVENGIISKIELDY